ncbi:lysosomal alpha-glucosidase-like [Bolinopsis microptera]|uniref:lysosomal alpha-glucosidase-like n=1 Tax=Bolinopsis microptera TaxID=2820187 RepID=UPI0030795811
MWNLRLLLGVLIIGTVHSIYKAVNVTRTDSTQIRATLVSPDKEMISPLSVIISLESEARVRIKILDPNNKRYEVPYPDTDEKIISNTERRYKVSITESPFSVQIHRSDDESLIFDTSSQELVFQNQFLKIGTTLPSTILYGIGEDSAPLLRDMDNKIHSLWTQGAYYLQGQGANLYGSHPFYLNIESAGSSRSNGVLLMNSNAMDILLTKTPVPSVTWKTIGGILDFSIFVGNNPLDVVRLYTERVGKPFLPPIWSLGFHLCRWGYNNTEYMESVMADMVLQGVPVDVHWNDIDHMDQYEDFTLSKRFAKLPEYVNKLHKSGKKYVMILDPAIHARFGQGYEPADSGLLKDVFIKNSTGELLIGNVWPGDTVFPDFLHPGTADWWSNQLTKFSKTVQYDGIWIDMNEPASFYDGSSVGCPWSDTLEEPPYLPGVRSSLQWQTLCMTAQQHQYFHYDVHNLYGWSESRATRSGLLSQRPSNRTFVLSRSTFVGSGRWAAHWTGDIRSTWSDMRATIPGLINMNMYGIPLVGADICGFEGDSNKELCIRWSQLGAYYPFSRNHNTIFAIPQEPTAWGTEATAIIRRALLYRYRLILYLYNLFVQSHSDGTPVMQALFMQFPGQEFTYDLDRQFMLGAGIMVCPTLEEGAETVWIYFPPATWYSVWDLELVSEGGEVVSHFPAPLDTINVFVRGGTVLPVVIETEGETPTAEQVLSSPHISVHCYLDQEGEATGTLFVDDGYSEDRNRPVHQVKFTVSQQQLTISPVTTGEMVRVVSSVKIAGVVLVGEKVEVLVGAGVQQHVSYNSDTLLLTVYQLKGEAGIPLTTDTDITITWRVARGNY